MMDNLDFNQHDAQHLFDFSTSDSRSHSYPPYSSAASQPAWPPLAIDGMEKMDNDHMVSQQSHHAQSYPMPSASSQQQSSHQAQQHNSRPSSNHSSLPPNALDFQCSQFVPNNWQYAIQQHAAQPHPHHFSIPQNNGLDMNSFNTASFGGQMQTSPVDFIPATTAESFAVTTGMDTNSFMTMAGPMDSMNALVFPLNDYQNDMAFPMALNNAALHQHALNQQAAESAQSSLAGSSPTGTIYEVQSLSDNEWSVVNYHPNRNSYDSFGTVDNPSEKLHIRTNSDSSCSDEPHSADLSGSYEEIPPWPLHSPHDFHGSEYLDQQYIQSQTHGLPITRPQHSPSSSLAVSPSAGIAPSYRSSGSSSTSPTSSGPTSPPLRRRKSPLDGKTTKAVIKKTPHSTRKDATAEKKVGRRRGPLRPDQRQQAHEIRKLRACLRCKFLKKTCDKGEPCAWMPDHAMHGCGRCRAREWISRTLHIS